MFLCGSWSSCGRSGSLLGVANWSNSSHSVSSRTCGSVATVTTHSRGRTGRICRSRRRGTDRTHSTHRSSRISSAIGCGSHSVSPVTCSGSVTCRSSVARHSVGTLSPVSVACTTDWRDDTRASGVGRCLLCDTNRTNRADGSDWRHDAAVCIVPSGIASTIASTVAGRSIAVGCCGGDWLNDGRRGCGFLDGGLHNSRRCYRFLRVVDDFPEWTYSYFSTGINSVRWTVRSTGIVSTVTSGTTCGTYCFTLSMA